jgi:hypothetical protein
MSCYFVPPTGGPAKIFPLLFAELQTIYTDGGDAMAEALRIDLKKLKPPQERFIGVSYRPDGEPFYVATIAPFSFEAVFNKEWSGAFYVPLRYGRLVGTVKGEKPGAGSSAYFAVDAKLYVGDKKATKVAIAANWRVLGPRPFERGEEAEQQDRKANPGNLMALIDRVEITKSGAHKEDDMRRCIALHAPAAAWGEPKGLVAQQCGVAVAGLIEAIC